MFGAIGSGLASAGKTALGYVASALSSPLGQAGIGAASGIGGDFLQGVMNNYFGKKSSKYSSKQSYHYQRKLNQWLIPYQLEQQNKYAEEYQKMYSRNSPSWNVEGLRKAGLNPILAASGGFSATPAARPTASGSIMGTTNYQPSTRGSVRFDPLTLKQLQLMDEQIKGQQIKNNNDAKNMGLTGRDATVARIASELGLTPDNLRAFLGFDFETSDNRPSDKHTYKFLGLNKSESDRVSAFLHFLNSRPITSPIIDISKAAEPRRIEYKYGTSAGNAESYKAWLAHPSNSSRRTHTWAENEYLFKRDVSSGLWRKKSDGKYGYK